MDFVREDGAWKVWHLHYFRLIKCDYQKGWVEDFSMENSPEGTARGPVTYHNPYTPHSVRVGIPACPAPCGRGVRQKKKASVSTQETKA